MKEKEGCRENSTQPDPTISTGQEIKDRVMAVSMLYVGKCHEWCLMTEKALLVIVTGRLSHPRIKDHGHGVDHETRVLCPVAPAPSLSSHLPAVHPLVLHPEGTQQFPFCRSSWVQRLSAICPTCRERLQLSRAGLPETDSHTKCARSGNGEKLSLGGTGRDSL
jgi:hypothetical protein